MVRLIPWLIVLFIVGFCIGRIAHVNEIMAKKAVIISNEPPCSVIVDPVLTWVGQCNLNSLTNI